MEELFNDLFDLLDAAMENAGDTLWYDKVTTAHERLVDLACRVDPIVGKQLQARMEELTSGSPPKVSRKEKRKLFLRMAEAVKPKYIDNISVGTFSDGTKA